MSTNASNKYARLENPRVKQRLPVYMRIAVSESPAALPLLPPAAIPFIWFPTPSAELEAATRTCLTQTGASGTSNSFSTLRWDPFAVLTLPACHFRFRRSSLPLPLFLQCIFQCKCGYIFPHVFSLIMWLLFSFLYFPHLVCKFYASISVSA